LSNLVNVFNRKFLYKNWKKLTSVVGKLIHKKGDMIICDNYRAVTLLFTTYKILANVLYVKLVPHAEEITGALRRVSKRKINC
jgi:hypothetical protein